jgi:hypothetical protein
VKSLLALLASALSIVSAAGCAGSSTGGGSASHGSSSAATQSTSKLDRDDDGDNNDDDAQVLYYGHEPTAPERQAIVALVTSYYAASAAADGAKACALLMPFVAESVVEDYSHRPGLHGHTCSTVMTKFFEQRHQLLSGENATLRFVSLRVQGGRALTVLSFSVLPEVRQIAARRNGDGWKILNLFDGIIE